MMGKILLTFIISLWVSGSPLFCQHGNLFFHHLRLRDGLSQATNSFVYKDQRGFVWISSINGLNRFDGTNVKVYYPHAGDSCALKGENIQSSFFEDSASGLWFTTFDAIIRYDWPSDCFASYSLPQEPGKSPVSGYYVFHMDPQGGLWTIVNGDSLYIFQTQDTTFHFICALDEICMRGVAIENESGQVTQLFLHSLNQPTGILHIDLQDKNNMPVSKFLWSDLAQTASGSFRKLIQEGDSLLWILTPQILIRYSLNSKLEKRFSLPYPDARSFDALNDSILMIGFSAHGLLECNKHIFSMQREYRHQPGLPMSLLSDHVLYVHTDRDGGLWVGIDGIGVSYTYPRKVKFNTMIPSQAYSSVTDFDPVTFLPGHDQSILCLTGAGQVWELMRHGHDFQMIPREAITSRIPASKIFTGFQDADGWYWISTWRGISIYHDSPNLLQRITDGSHVAYSIAELSDGRILMSTNQSGLHEVHEHKGHNITLDRILDIPSDLGIYPVWQDQQGRIWLGENLQSFGIYDAADMRKVGTLAVEGICHFISQTSSIPSVWLATSTGLYEVDTDSLYIKAVYNRDTGMPTAGFTSMVVDRQEKIWLTHQQGIIRFDPVMRTHRAFTPEDGLPLSEFTKAAYEFKDGEIWMGAVESITRFYPDQIRDLEVLAIPQITEIMVNEEAIPFPLRCELTGATNAVEIRKLTFDHRHRTLAIRIHALEYSAPALNKVRYQLIGLDEKSIEVTSGSQVRYPNLPAGSYRFVLYAVNSDGIYNPVPRELFITITPPFYKTWWFITLMAMAVMSILAYIIYLRFSKTLDLQRVRLKLYENLHDDVGSRLTAIVLSAEEIERNEKWNHPKLQSIAHIARNIVSNMRRLVWAIDPENDRMASMLQKINHDGGLILGDTVELELNAPEALKSMVIPGEIRYQMVSICNEAFNNISKYAKAHHVNLTFVKEGRVLKMTIRDDGVGFNPAEQARHTVSGSGYGLTNMRKRAARVKGQLQIESKPGAGTVVEAHFPLS